jgi:predicted DNA-binding transcriptional regulator YafY
MLVIRRHVEHTRDIPGQSSSPTARALQAFKLIQASPGITADPLGTALGVAGRAARRYVAILREADLPIESGSPTGEIAYSTVPSSPWLQRS